MFKICHLTSVHRIDDVRIFEKECISLAASGFDVSLIACGDNAFEDFEQGVKRISLYVPVTNRLQRMIQRPKAIYNKAVIVNADIYHFHDPELLPIGLKLKKLGKKVIYDSHEDTSVLIKTRKWIPAIIRNLLSYIYRNYEKNCIKKIDAVISVTPLIVEKFSKINRNSYLITNFPKLTDLEANTERKNVCFAGNITHAYMFNNVLDALYKTNGIKLILAGTPVSNKYLNELKQLKGWSKVIYLGRISHNEVQSLYKKTMVGIACLAYTANVGYKEGSLGMLKTFEYMNAGMALICTDFKLWKQIVEKYNCGICVSPYDIENIFKAIQYLVDNPSVAREMGNNGRKAVECEYNWATQEKILVNLYRSLLRH